MSCGSPSGQPRDKYGPIFIFTFASLATLAAPSSLVVKELMCDRRVQILLWIIWCREIWSSPTSYYTLLPALPLWMNMLKQKNFICRTPSPQGNGSNFASNEAKPGNWAGGSCRARLTIICHGLVPLSFCKGRNVRRGIFKIYIFPCI